MQCTVTLAKSYRPLWGRMGKRLTYNFYAFHQGPSSGKLGHPFIQRVLCLQTGSSLEILSSTEIPLCHDPMQSLFAFGKLSAYTDQTKLHLVSYLFHASQQHD